MVFILGFLMGLIAAIGLLGLLAYWLCSRSNNVAVAKFINGIAQALAHKPKSAEPSTPESSEPLIPGENGKAMEEPGERTKNRQGRNSQEQDARLY